MADEQDWVYISHPQVDAIGGPVLRASFEDLWKAKGWSTTEDYALVVDDEGQQKAVPKRKLAGVKKEG